MRLKNPENNIAAIRQDYRDKHASGGALFAGRKYDRPVKNRDGKFVPCKDGSLKMWRPYVQLKQLITSEDMMVEESFKWSEDYKNDCYATINSFPADCDSRVADNVAYLTGYYIDFDNRAIHTLAKNQQASKFVEEAISYANQIVQILEDYLPSDYGMPVLSYTGGGYGFYFRLKPLEATAENKALYKEIHEQLYQRFNILFESLLDVFDNDHSVVGDIVRIIRITGTYNDKTGAFAKYIARYGNESTNEVYEYSLDEISSLYHLDDIEAESNTHLVSLAPLPKKKEKKREKKESPNYQEGFCMNDRESSWRLAKQGERLGQIVQPAAYTERDNVIHPTKWYQGWVNAKQIDRYLDLATASLHYLDSQGALQRNNALFLIACLKTEIEYAQYGSRIFSCDRVAQKVQREIIDDIIELNECLSEPLEDYELAAILNHALTNNYHFRKLETIQKFLNLTNEEYDALGWMDGKKRREQWQERSNELIELDKEVIRLYLSGLSDAKIAKELDIPKLQSIRIRKRLGVMDRNTKWEDVDFEGNKRHLKHKTNRVPDAAEMEILAKIRRLTDEMERIADSQICDISPMRFRDFLGSPCSRFFSDFWRHLENLGIDKNDAIEIAREKSKQMKEYAENKRCLNWLLEELEEMRKEAAEKQAEKQAKQAAKILRSDSASWFCHEPKFNRRNHANLVVDEIDGQNRAYYI